MRFINNPCSYVHFMRFCINNSRYYSCEANTSTKTNLCNEQTIAVTKFDAPLFFELDGIGIIPDERIWNISPRVKELLNRRLLSECGNPLNILKKTIISYFDSVYRKTRSNSPFFVVCENEPRLVNIFDNFDSLFIPENHPSRRKSDTYYINNNWCLRAHTSAHQVRLLRQGLDNFLVVGDVYRRDEIDRTHFPCFHQIEGVSTYALHEIIGENSQLHLERDKKIGERTPEKQEQHTIETVKFLEMRLKETLEKLCQQIFGNTVEQMRWVATYFPFTHPSFELEIFFDGKWLEILGCGIIEQKLLESAGANSRVGWAFGLGLERLAMVLYGIPDIRLFWSRDTGFLSQFADLNPGEIIKYKTISKQPQLYMDLSFWLPREQNFEFSMESLRADVYDVIRFIGGDLIEQVNLFDEFLNRKTGRKSQTYRIIYRSMERTLTKEEVNVIHKQIEKHLKEKFAVEIR